MASLFAARRKPKRITSSEPRDDDTTKSTQDAQQSTDGVADADTEDNGPVVRKPTTAPKQKSKLRISFDPGVANVIAGDSDVSTARRPQNSSRLAVSRAVETSREDRDRDGERPTYSKSYLDELKGSTPNTPKDLSAQVSSAEDDHDNDLALIQPQTQALDIASKFGATATKPGAIPSAAEIAEKKARRERLAKEAQASAITITAGRGRSVKNNDDYVSLEAYDSDGEFKPSRMQVSTYLQKDRADNELEYTRLLPEDEDIAEGFEQFVEDETLGQKKNKNRINMSMRLDSSAERAAIRKQIDAVEGGADADSDASDNSSSEASDASAEHAYMAAQTRHGAGFSHLSKEERRRQEREAQRPRQPDKTTPIPTLAAGVARLRELKEQAELGKRKAESRKVEIQRRLKEVAAEQVRIQSALDELGRQLEETNRRVEEQGEVGQRNGAVERGLDSMGGQGH
ncbi:hypothetical protein LTR64_001653 [Lithohypha guttulata]|uniref:uncharacterized protein n=1 Tax=Lithohypha guttulata TaxID=1690604 RepID=UPI002DE063CF|nr:hypothetical protein LTR51_003847 [Lithohypha guttulata]